MVETPIVNLQWTVKKNMEHAVANGVTFRIVDTHEAFALEVFTSRGWKKVYDVEYFDGESEYYFALDDKQGSLDPLNHEQEEAIRKDVREYGSYLASIGFAKV